MFLQIRNSYINLHQVTDIKLEDNYCWFYFNNNDNTIKVDNLTSDELYTLQQCLNKIISIKI